MKIIDCIQRSDEWYKARLGMITASKVKTVMSSGVGRRDYMYELACEILTGTYQNGYISSAMQHGIDTEATARTEYEMLTGNFVNEPGFVIHDIMPYLGCSPDGLIIGSHGLEIKCPKTATHIEFFETKKIKKEYLIQMHVGMMCCDVDLWHFVSYDNRLPDELCFCMVPINKDPALVNQITKEVMQFQSELQALLKKLMSLNNG